MSYGIKDNKCLVEVYEKNDFIILEGMTRVQPEWGAGTATVVFGIDENITKFTHRVIGHAVEVDNTHTNAQVKTGVVCWSGEGTMLSADFKYDAAAAPYVVTQRVLLQKI